MNSPVYGKSREADQHRALYYGMSIEVCIRPLRLLCRTAGHAYSVMALFVGTFFPNDN